MAGTNRRTHWLRHHPCTTLGIVLTLAFVLGMKEIRALFTDLPHVTWTKSGMVGLGLWLFVLLFALGSIISIQVGG